MRRLYPTFQPTYLSFQYKHTSLPICFRQYVFTVSQDPYKNTTIVCMDLHVNEQFGAKCNESHCIHTLKSTLEAKCRCGETPTQVWIISLTPGRPISKDLWKHWDDMMPAAGDNPKQFRWLFDPDVVLLCGTVAEVVTALNEISLTQHCLDAPLFSTPVTLPTPTLLFFFFFSHSNSC